MPGRKWGFYGRAAEIAELDRVLEPTEFWAIAYIGRRGVGKTALVREAVRRRGEAARTLFMELRPGVSGRDELDHFLQTVHIQRLQPMLEGWDSTRAANVSPAYAIEQAVDHLLRQGLTVVIDEFQNADCHPGMAAGFKRIIDWLRSAGQPGPGKLVLAGSDQQGMARLFSDPRQPLYQRATLRRVPAWSAAETMEMAADQGWLDHPGRFLTLWAAFGPVPRYWEEFHRLGPAELGAWREESRWRGAFLDWALGTADGVWGDHMHDWTRDELSEGNFAVLRALARHRRRGRAAAELRGDVGDAFGDPLERLENLGRMGMAVRVQPIWGPSGRPERWRWRVDDNFVLLWSGVLGPALKRRGEGGLRAEVRSAAERDLTVQEGHALESLARSAIRERWEREGVLVHRLEHGYVVERHSAGGRRTGAEFDMLGFTRPRENGPFTCWVGSCKRSPEQHDPRRHLEEPLQRARRSRPPESVRAWLDSERVGLLVSPAFTAEQRRRLESAPGPASFGRIECLDIRDLAAGLGIDLRPAPEPADPSPAPDFGYDPSP